LAFPLSLEATFGEQQEILDHQSDCQVAADFKHTQHGLACSNSLVRKARDGGHIVRQKNPALLCAPFQYSSVICPGKIDVLNSRNIQIRLAAQQPADDVVVEVLVSGKTKHESCTRIGLPGEQAVSHAGRIEPSFILRADGFRLPLALAEIAIHL
jgi:hypothetical protein